MAVELGAFQLLAPLAQGGMGEVWSARHRGSGLPVALKVITAKSACDPRFLRLFDREARAMAGLDHPNIARILDYGQVTASAEHETLGRLREGLPYLAMEYASGGDLKANLPDLNHWAAVRDVLMSLLDALAHAHAHGVIHRDIKMGNVLVCTDEDARPGLKLTDFGVARLEGTQNSMDHAVGTIHYMAPEQITSRHLEVGPWTDLYAVGCLAFRLIHGRLPFRGPGPGPVLYGHLHGEVPRLKPRFPIPDGLEAWVRTLLSKHWSDRYPFAADAAFALSSLGSVVPTRTVNPPPAPADDASISELPTDWVVPDLSDSPVPIERRLAHAPVPRNWRRQDRPPSLALRGAGLGLWGLRPLPMVGRITDRDALWSALVQVSRRRQPLLRLVRGRRDIGASRLARWLGIQAHAHGAADVLTLSLAPTDGPGEAIRRLAAQLTRTDGDRDQVLEQLRENLPHLKGEPPTEDDVHALADLIAPAAPGRGAHVGVGTSSEAGAILETLLTWLTRERPFVLVLDELQHGRALLPLLGRLLDGAKAAVLVVAAVEEEAIAADRTLSDSLTQLASARGAEVIELAPLGPVACQSLAEQLLGLAPELASEVGRRSQGFAGHAVQLVSHWVQANALHLGPKGFALASQVRVPDTMYKSWQQRQRWLSEALGATSQRRLERAAVLGLRVTDAHWRSACNVPPGALRPLRRWLMDHSLAQKTKDGWRFLSVEFRAGLLRSAEENGRLQSHHLACAAALADSEDPDQQERLGMHWLQGGEPARALEPLLAGGERRAGWLGYAHALAFVDEALASLGPEDSYERCALEVRRAEWLRAVGRYEEANEVSRSADSMAARGGWALLQVSARTELGAVLFRQGAYEQSRTELESARELASSLPASREYGRALVQLGSLQLLTEGPAAAWIHLRLAERILAEVGADVDRSRALALCASCRWQARDLESTKVFAERAYKLFERLGERAGMGQTLNVFGEVLRAQGDLAGAYRVYEQAHDLNERVGSDLAHMSRLNQALVRYRQGRYREVLALVEQTAPRLIALGWRPLVGISRLLEACALAALTHLEAAEVKLHEASELLGGLVDTDVTSLAVDLGRISSARPNLSRAAWSMAIAHSHPDAAERAEAEAALTKIRQRQT